MKEGARRLRNSFSKRRQEDGNLTPSWGVSLEDDGEEEEDAEYLGAPSNKLNIIIEGLSLFICTKLQMLVLSYSLLYI